MLDATRGVFITRNRPAVSFGSPLAAGAVYYAADVTFSGRRRRARGAANPYAASREASRRSLISEGVVNVSWLMLIRE